MDDKTPPVTPGQAAYEAYLAHLQGADPGYGQWVKPFAGIDKHDRDAWEAAVSDVAGHLAEENRRLRMLIGELLDNTGLDDAERAEWLDRNRLSESAVYPNDDEDETTAILADPDTMAAIAEGEADL